MFEKKKFMKGSIKKVKEIVTFAKIVENQTPNL
jgi:hypothetical protein